MLTKKQIEEIIQRTKAAYDKGGYPAVFDWVKEYEKSHPRLDRGDCKPCVLGDVPVVPERGHQICLICWSVVERKAA
jgi:hypothetical protein